MNKRKLETVEELTSLPVGSTVVFDHNTSEASQAFGFRGQAYYVRDLDGWKLYEWDEYSKLAGMYIIFDEDALVADYEIGDWYSEVLFDDEEEDVA
jgi:hypothetical protein